jgi:hypothetical protein
MRGHSPAISNANSSSGAVLVQATRGGTIHDSRLDWGRTVRKTPQLCKALELAQVNHLLSAAMRFLAREDRQSRLCAVDPGARRPIYAATFRRIKLASLRSLLALFLLFGRYRPSILPHSTPIGCRTPIHTLGSTGPSFLDHDARGGEPLDCSIIEAVLAQHLVRVLRKFGWS